MGRLLLRALKPPSLKDYNLSLFLPWASWQGSHNRSNLCHSSTKMHFAFQNPNGHLGNSLLYSQSKLSPPHEFVGTVATFCRHRSAWYAFQHCRWRHSTPKKPLMTINEFFKKAQVITTVRDLLKNSVWDSCTVDLLKTFEGKLDSFVVAQVLRSGVPAETAVAFFNWLKTCPGFSHNLHTYHAIIEVLGNARRVVDMKAMVEEFRGIGSEKVSIHLANLMRWHGQGKDLEGALKIWDQMKKDSAGVTTESYNILIDLHAEEKRYREAAEFFLKMVQKGCVPNSRTYTILIKHLVKANKLEGALEIFQMLPQLRVTPTMLQFLDLAVAFARAGNADMVKHLIRRVRENGNIPHKAFYLTVSALKKAGKLDEAESVFIELWPELGTEEERARFMETVCEVNNIGFSETNYEADLPHKSLTSKISSEPWLNPNALASVLRHWTPGIPSALQRANLKWNTQLVCEVLRSFKKADHAWNFFSWLEQQPAFIHDSFTFSRMILMFADDGNFPAVEHLLEKAKRDGLMLPISTINSLIKVCGLARNSEGALRIFWDMGFFGLKPDRDTYSFLLHTLAKCNNGSKAVEILEEMEQAGYQPDVLTLTVLMQHFGLAGDIRMAQRLFAWIFYIGCSPNAHAYTTLIDAYCRSGNSGTALKIFEDMKLAGVSPTTATQSILVRGLHRDGKVQQANSLENQTFPSFFPGGIRKASHEDLMLIYGVFWKNLNGSLNSVH